MAGAIEGYGAILIAGTGTVCYGKDPDGEYFRVGGFGYLVDDLGGGYAIGRDILTAVIRAADQREGATEFSRLAAERLRIPKGDMQALTTWMYAPETGKKEIASLAELLPEALGMEDPAACRIAAKAADDLAELVLTGWRRSGMKDGELALAGSILQKVPGIRCAVAEKILKSYPGIRIMDPLRSPAEGAARMARTEFST